MTRKFNAAPLAALAALAIQSGPALSASNKANEPALGVGLAEARSLPKWQLRSAQIRLQALGYPVDGPDGVWGARSRSSLSEFLADHDLPDPANGELTPASFGLLMSEKARPRSADPAPK